MSTMKGRIAMELGNWHMDMCYPYASDFEAEDGAAKVLTELLTPTDEMIEAMATEYYIRCGAGQIDVEKTMRATFTAAIEAALK